MRVPAPASKAYFARIYNSKGQVDTNSSTFFMYTNVETPCLKRLVRKIMSLSSRHHHIEEAEGRGGWTGRLPCPMSQISCCLRNVGSRRAFDTNLRSLPSILHIDNMSDGILLAPVHQQSCLISSLTAFSIPKRKRKLSLLVHVIAQRTRSDSR
jgi:hypothetical protein